MLPPVATAIDATIETLVDRSGGGVARITPQKRTDAPLMVPFACQVPSTLARGPRSAPLTRHSRTRPVARERSRLPCPVLGRCSARQQNHAEACQGSTCERSCQIVRTSIGRSSRRFVWRAMSRVNRASVACVQGAAQGDELRPQSSFSLRSGGAKDGPCVKRFTRRLCSASAPDALSAAGSNRCPSHARRCRPCRPSANRLRRPPASCRV